MRIDTVEQKPIPEIPKVQESGSSGGAKNDLTGQRAEAAATQQGKTAAAAQTRFSGEKAGEESQVSAQASKKIEYKINKDPYRVVTEIVDGDTNEVIEQIPSKNLLDIMDSLNKVFGDSVDKKV